MSVAQVKQFLSNYRRMLSGVRTKLRRDFPNKNWEYDLVFPYYFQAFIHLDPARPDSTQDNPARSQKNVFNAEEFKLSLNIHKSNLTGEP